MGSYLATAGDAQAGDEIQIFSFNRDAGTLTKTDGKSQGDSGYVVAWSPDGAYLGTGGFPEGGDSIQIFSFNRFTGTLTKVDGVSLVDEGISLSWSPDGAYLAAGGITSGANDEIKVFQALTFPSLNVIKDNVVHGASGGDSLLAGVGISGSSIENFIVGNSSHNNASFNYQFVTNVFDQRFDTTPSLLQNFSINTQNPIYAP